MAQSSNVSNTNIAQICTSANSYVNTNTLSTQNIAGLANSDLRQTTDALIQVPRNRTISGPYSSNDDDVNRFLNDEEVRKRLLNIRDNINIRESSQLYNKMRKKNKSFEPLVILLRYRASKNMVPKEGTST